MTDKTYDFMKIEAKWQKIWESKKTFEAKGKGKKFYVLEMFPYPSGTSLHMGHAFNYTIGDVFARFKLMQGFNVLHPMGFDSFGLPAENAAIKEKSHPKKFIDVAIKSYIELMKKLGFTYDWSRMLKTSDPEYYKWNQYFFLKFLERGLVYRKKSSVNWCPKCDTVLANEQVHQGKCWRHEDTDVEIRKLEQWFIKTTMYSEELLKDIEKLDWPERIKIMQRNWIGKSEGTEIAFEINGKNWKVFTTRPDTIFGVTFMVVSAQHPDLMQIVTQKQKSEVEKFLKKIKTTKQSDIDKLEKQGVFTGSYALHPLTKEKIPVWIGNFVVAEYGSGTIMCVPGHDSRDLEFAKKYKLPVKQVINNDKLVNSKEFNGLFADEAKEHITKALEFKKIGKKVTQYKMRDWLVSRQRYWGTPIPIIYCDKCGIVPVLEKDLPVLLPEKVTFGKGNPLKTNKDFLSVKCSKCSGEATRETDTMDTFFDSSWYFLRYTDNKNSKAAFDNKKMSYWMPVDQYIGGAEHACMHLLYARFFTKALRDLRLLSFDEPFTRLFNQGMLHGEDGFVMSKSRGNYVLPEEVSKKYGIDTARLFLVSIAAPDKDIQWNEKGIEGSFRFVNKVMDYCHKGKFGRIDEKTQSKVNKTIKEVTQDIENFQHNAAVIKIRDLFSYLENGSDKKSIETFLKLLTPFCPHVSEELWQKIGNKTLISLEKWPIADENKIDERFDKEEKDVETLIEDVKNIVRIVRERGKTPKTLYIYTLPKELNTYSDNEKEIGRRTELNIKIYSVSDKNKHDPESKSKKSKPGKPGIYLE